MLTPWPRLSAAEAEAGPSLAEAAALSGRFFGAALRIEQLERVPRLASAVQRDCSCVTPEIHLKWNALEPRPGAYAFGPADALLDYAGRNGMRARGHTLLWDQGLPDWTREALAGGASWDIVARYFEAVVARYPAIREWDVVNEPIADDGLVDNAFKRAFGPSYVERALVEARRHAPGAKLMINDYGFDYANTTEERRRHHFLRLVERLKARGVPLDGVGIQAHLDLSKGPLRQPIVERFLGELAGLGVAVVITELDVKENRSRLPLAERDRRVAAEAGAYLDVALAQPAVTGVVTWGLDDRHSWLSEDGRVNRGLPYDETLGRKPMYWAIRDAFLRHA